MPPVLWLASYPKSGNTWLRFLLHAVQHGPAQRSADVSATIPDLHRAMPTDPAAEQRSRFGPAHAGLLPIKTHFELSPQHPRLRDTRKAVHIVRHPRDVLLSGLNYLRLGGTTPAQLSDAAYAELFIKAGGDPGFAKQGFGTWASHAESWLHADFPVHTIRYEDLHADTPAMLRGVLEFLEHEASDETIAAACKASAFDQLKALEVREKHDRSKKGLDQRLFVGDVAAARKGALFMNAGKHGQRLDTIAPGLDHALDQVMSQQCGALLKRFGYAAAD